MPSCPTETPTTYRYPCATQVFIQPSPRGYPRKNKAHADWLLQTIHQYSITIAASFPLYEDIGRLYVKINDDHLIEGITLVRSMGNPDRRTMEMKQADLSRYAKKAAVGTKDKVKEVSPRDRLLSIRLFMLSPTARS